MALPGFPGIPFRRVSCSQTPAVFRHLRTLPAAFDSRQSLGLRSHAAGATSAIIQISGLHSTTHAFVPRGYDHGRLPSRKRASLTPLLATPFDVSDLPSFGGLTDWNTITNFMSLHSLPSFRTRPARAVAC